MEDVIPGKIHYVYPTSSILRPSNIFLDTELKAKIEAFINERRGISRAAKEEMDTRAD
jgi:hypothetical protein